MKSGTQKVLFIFELFEDYNQPLVDAVINELAHQNITLRVMVLQGFGTRDFGQFMSKSLSVYDYFIFWPPVKNNNKSYISCLNQIPADKMLLLNNRVKGLKRNINSITRFEKKYLSEFLKKIPVNLNLYNTIVLLLDAPKPPMLKDIEVLLNEKGVDFYSKKSNEVKIQDNTLYLVYSEDELFALAKTLEKSNELDKLKNCNIALTYSPYHDLLIGGLGTFTIDEDKTAKLIKEVILNRLQGNKEIPYKFIPLKSLA
mgnify:CR=1 FL=1